MSEHETYEIGDYDIGQWFLREEANEIYVLSLVSSNDRKNWWNLICINDGYRWDESFGTADDGRFRPHKCPVECLDDWLGSSRGDFLPIDNPARKAARKP